jgi:L-amino acid N-acyltransferase YncA
MSKILASLIAQAEGRGVDLVTLRALVEEAAELGARRALAQVDTHPKGRDSLLARCGAWVARSRRDEPKGGDL